MTVEVNSADFIEQLESWYLRRHRVNGAELSNLSRPISGVVNDTVCYCISFVEGDDRSCVGHVLRRQPEGEKPIARVDVLE